MKILYIARSTIPSRDANSIQVMKMCQAFADNGHEVLLLVPDKKAKMEKTVDDIHKYYGVKNSFTINGIRIKHKNGRAFFEIIEIKKALLNFQPDLVYSRCFLGCTIACLNGYQTMYESHLPIWTSSSIKKTGFLLLSKHNNFKRLIVISQALKDIYLNENIIKTDKIFVAHDGSDVITDVNSKVELSGNSNKLNIGYSGHLYKGKGIEIIAQIAPLAKDFNFHIVGGTENDIEYWKSVIPWDNVFFYGFKPQNELHKYINSFDVCLLPNQKIVLPCGKHDHKYNISNFTSPLKMFEYMAHKKAIIASDLPVLREVLNESNAILVQCDDIDGWLKALEGLKNVKAREGIAENAYNNFISRYTWKNRAALVIT